MLFWCLIDAQRSLSSVVFYLDVFVADFFMEAKFNSFVESFFISLSDSQFENAREQLDLMKKWYEAYVSSLQSIDTDQIDKQLLDNVPLYKQVRTESLSDE